MTAPQLRARSRAPEETHALGATAAAILRPGDVVALSGELGGGKTCFVRGVARGLGVRSRVTSPTFTLVRTYPEATIPIVHCDVYRLDTVADVLDLGDEVLADDRVTLLEWGDAVAPLLPPDRIDVEIVVDDDDGSRALTATLHGDASQRCDALREHWAGWLDGEA